MSARRIVLLLAFAAAAAIVVSEPAFAQCAMCRTALEQNGGAIAGGFNRAILFLLGMPYLVFAAVGGAWYWKRRARTRERTAPRETSWRPSLTPSPR